MCVPSCCSAFELLHKSVIISHSTSPPAALVSSINLSSRACGLQMGFFSIVGIPLFKAMAELFEESNPMLDGVLANYHHWEAATPDAELPP